MIVVTYYRVSDSDIEAITPEDIGDETMSTIVDDMALDAPPNVMYHLPDGAEDALTEALAVLEMKGYLKLTPNWLKMIGRLK